MRSASVRSLERRLARLYRSADSAVARAELLVTLARTFAVLAATHTHRGHHHSDPAVQAEIEHVLHAAQQHLHAAHRRQQEP